MTDRMTGEQGGCVESSGKSRMGVVRGVLVPGSLVDSGCVSLSSLRPNVSSGHENVARTVQHAADFVYICSLIGWLALWQSRASPTAALQPVQSAAHTAGLPLLV